MEQKHKRKSDLKEIALGFEEFLLVFITAFINDWIISSTILQLVMFLGEVLYFGAWGNLVRFEILWWKGEG